MIKKRNALALLLGAFAMIACSFVSCKQNDDDDDSTTGLSATTASIVIGATKTLTLTVDDAAIDSANVTWESDDTTVATVSAGVVSGAAIGSAKITATYNNSKYYCTITVTEATVPYTFTFDSTVVSNLSAKISSSQTKTFVCDDGTYVTGDTAAAETRCSNGAFVYGSASGLIYTGPSAITGLATYYYGNGSSDAVSNGDTVTSFKNYISLSADQLTSSGATSIKVTVNAQGYLLNSNTSSTETSTQTAYGRIGLVTVKGVVLEQGDVLTDTAKDYTFYVTPGEKIYITNTAADNTNVMINSISTEASSEAVTAVVSNTKTCATGAYNLYDTSVAKGTEITDGSSDDTFVSWSGIYSNGNTYAYTDSSSKVTIYVGGPCKIAMSNTYAGTNGKTVTVVDASSNTLVNAGSATSDYAFIYSGTSATTLTMTFSGYMYISTLTVTYGTYTNSCASIKLSGDSSVVVGSTITLTATETATYINTDSNAYTPAITWTSATTADATVAGSTDTVTGTVTGVATGSSVITATDGDVSDTKTITVTATATTYSQYSYAMWGASGTYTSWTSNESSSAVLTLAGSTYYTDAAGTTSATGTWTGNTGYGILTKAGTISIPVTGAATVTVFVTYEGNYANTMTLTNGSTVIDSAVTLAKGDTKGGKPYTFTYTGTDATTLTLTIANATTGSVGTTYIGEIYVDYDAVPSSVTACTYDLSSSSADSPLTPSAGGNELLWYETSNTYLKYYTAGWYTNSAAGYFTFAVGGACTITVTSTSNSTTTSGTYYLYDATQTSLTTTAYTAVGDSSLSYTGNAGFVSVYIPAGMEISAITVAASN